MSVLRSVCWILNFSQSSLNWLELLKSGLLLPATPSPPGDHLLCHIGLSYRSGPWILGKFPKQSPAKLQDGLVTQWEAVFLPESDRAWPHLKEGRQGCELSHSLAVCGHTDPASSQMRRHVCWFTCTWGFLAGHLERASFASSSFIYLKRSLKSHFRFL